MASQNINVGTNADDGTGESLRSAFIDIRKMFAEVYNQTYTSDTQDLSGATFDLYSKPDLTLVGNTLTLTKPDATTDTVDLSPYLDEDARAIASGTIDGAGIVTFTRDDATTFTLDLSSLLDDTNLVTSVNTQVGAVVLDSDDIAEGSTNLYDQTVTLTASTGMSITGTYPDFTIASVIQGNATHTGDVTGSTALTIAADAVDGTKIADDSIDSEHYVDGSIDTAHIADNQITHAKLEDRYTAVQDISTTSGTINLDASSYAAFNLTGNLTTATLNVQNIKTGQAIDILLSGTLTSAVLTLADDFTTSAINKVGSNDLDTSGTNLIQLLCVDDTDSDAILTWAVATYTTDTSA